MQCSSLERCETVDDEVYVSFKPCDWSDFEMTQEEHRIPEASVLLVRGFSKYPQWP